MKRSLPAMSLLLLSLATAGCVLPGEGSREVLIAPTSRPIQYIEEFDEAYAAPSPDGGYDLVMSRGYQSESTHAGERVYPAARSAVAQVLHIHVAWRPARGRHSDFPAATNSTVVWYAFTDPASQTPSYTRYSGIGFVAIEVGGSSTLFALRDMTIKPELMIGKSADPLGEARLTGKIRAKNDQARVRAILGKLQQDISPAEPGALQQPIPQQLGMPPARRQGP